MIKTAKDKNVELNVLISESIDLNLQEVIGEIENGTKVFKFRTPLNHTSRKTYNGNLFTREFLESGLNNERFQRRMKKGNLLGEFQHPLRNNRERFVQVYDEKVSHKINDVWFEGELLMGDIQTVTFSKGPELAKKIAEDITPAFSLRAVGKARRNAQGEKEQYLTIITWDNVFDASEKAAWADEDTIKMSEPSLRRPTHMNDKDSGNEMAKKIFNECKLDEIEGEFRDIDDDIHLLAESFGGVRPDKVMYDSNNNIIGYYSETVSAKRKVKDKLANDINDFMRS